MPDRPVIEIEVRDEEFRRFYDLFSAYSDALDEQPEAYRKLEEAMGGAMGTASAGAMGAKEAFAVAAAQAGIISEALLEAVGAQRELTRSTGPANQGLSKMATTAKSISHTVFSIATNLLKIGAAGLGIGALAGFGLGGLAAGAFNRQKDASGIGVSTGELASFKVNAQEFLGVGALQAAASAQTDLGQAGNFAKLGMDFRNVQNADPAKLAFDELIKAREAWVTGQRMGIPPQSMPGVQAYQALGGDLSDVRRVADPAEYQRLLRARAQTFAEAPGLNVSRADADGLMEFKKQLDRAGESINKDLIMTLGPLAPVLTDLSKHLVDLAGQVLGSADVQKAIKDGSQALADMLTKTDWAGIGRDLDAFAQGLAPIAKFFGILFDGAKNRTDEQKLNDMRGALQGGPLETQDSKDARAQAAKDNEAFFKQFGGVGSFFSNQFGRAKGALGGAWHDFNENTKLIGLQDIWKSADGDPRIAQQMAAIADAESGGDPNNIGINRDKKGNIVSRDWGLFQINDAAHADELAKAGLKNWRTDPYENARAAVMVAGKSGDKTPWTTWREYNARENTRAAHVISSDLARMRGTGTPPEHATIGHVVAHPALAKALDKNTKATQANSKAPKPVHITIKTPTEANYSAQANAAAY